MKIYHQLCHLCISSDFIGLVSVEDDVFSKAYNTVTLVRKTELFSVQVAIEPTRGNSYEP